MCKAVLTQALKCEASSISSMVRAEGSGFNLLNVAYKYTVLVVK